MARLKDPHAVQQLLDIKARATKHTQDTLEYLKWLPDDDQTRPTPHAEEQAGGDHCFLLRQPLFFTYVLSISGFVREPRCSNPVTWKPQLRREAPRNWVGKSRYCPCFVFCSHWYICILLYFVVLSRSSGSCVFV
jgi:hypothetical protein